MTSGSGVITCTAGTWSNVNMKCTLKNCGAFDEVPNGEIDYREGTNFGAKIVISCNTGYVLVGKGQIVCGDGGWEGRAPSCEVMTCDPPPAFSGGSFSPDKESYDYREVIQYTCNKELTLNGSSAVSCSEHGKFTPHPPTCVRVQCEEPVIKNGDWVQGSRPPYGFRATLTYKCKKGFEIKGDATFTCDINSRWSPALPTCNRVTCAKRPAKVDHGSFSPDKESYQYEDVVQYSCANGFELQGSNSITCSADGTFKPAPPRCNRVTCVKLPAKVDHGSFSPDKESYQYEDVVQYSCASGFELQGSNSITCSADGTFKPAPPRCNRVTCAKLPAKVDHGSFSPDKESYQYEDVVQYSCANGFELQGSNSITCSADGTFKPAPPRCNRVTCAKLPAKVDHGSFSPDKESYQYEDVVQYSCANGFELQGSNSITCSADGTFKPAPPRCNPTKGTGAAGGSDKVGWGLGIGLALTQLFLKMRHQRENTYHSRNKRSAVDAILLSLKTSD
ncbi:C4b-binding protein alpha chain [Symphorus nematophorus]